MLAAQPPLHLQVIFSHESLCKVQSVQGGSRGKVRYTKTLENMCNVAAYVGKPDKRCRACIAVRSNKV